MEILEVKKLDNDLNEEQFCKYIDATVFNSKIKDEIKEMLGVVLSTGENDINLDFNDLKVIMELGDIAFVGTGEAIGKDSATKALNLAVENAALDYSARKSALAILIHFEIHPDFLIIDIAEAMEVINEYAHYEADIIWGTTTNSLLNNKYIKATILFIGSKTYE